MKPLEKTCFVGIIIFLVIIILILPLKMVLFNNQYYYSQFEKNDIYSKINQTQANNILDNLLLFFQDKEPLKYFEANEQSHLQDVKVLLNKFIFVFNISLILFLLLIILLVFVNKEKFLDNFFKAIFLGGLVSFSLIILISLASLNFEITFQGFHKIFFSQGNYSFSQSSLLITLFPQIFFKDFLLKILLIASLTSIGAMIPQLILNKLR